MIVKVIDAPKSNLGEGIYLDRSSSELYWLDIIGNSIYRYDLRNNVLINDYKVELNPSCILSISDSFIKYVDREGVKKIDKITGKQVCNILSVNHDTIEYRANDGVELRNGSIVFGSMSTENNENPGLIYTIVNGEITPYDFGIGIPNTFVYDEEYLYISDSYNKKTYKIKTTSSLRFESEGLQLWKDFSDKDYTPDGGCISEKGYLHIALWGGGAVGVYDKYGNTKKMITLPVLQPTNCIILDNRWLFITSAFEGMTEEQLKEYPLSGQTLVVDLGNNYEY